MSDIPILANTVSALWNTLSQGSSIDPYMYKLSQPYPNNSRTKIVVKPTSAMAFDSQCIFRIPRYGLLQAAAIKVQIDLGVNSVPGNPAGSQELTTTLKAISDEFALFLCNKISLTSHSKEIEALVPYSQLAEFLHKDRETQAGLSDAMNRGYAPLGGGDLMDKLAKQPPSNDAATNDQSIVTFYIPLMFSFSKHLSNALDVSFLEELEIVCDVGKKSDLLGGNLNNATANAANGCRIINSELLCYFHSLDNAHMKSLQQSQFNLKSGQPLTCLYSNAFEENPVKFTSGLANTLQTINVDLSCKHLAYETLIAIEADPGVAYGDTSYLRGTGAQMQIAEVELFMSGRSIWKTTEIESSCLEAALLGNSRGRTPGMARANTGSPNNDIRMIAICWSNSIKDALSQMSGALSFKGASSPQLSITFKVTAPNAAHTCYVAHRYYSAVSFSGSDGRVSSGLNL